MESRQSEGSGRKDRKQDGVPTAGKAGGREVGLGHMLREARCSKARGYLPFWKVRVGLKWKRMTSAGGYALSEKGGGAECRRPTNQPSSG